MKKRTIAVALLLAAAVGLLSGCSSEEEIFYSPGYWRDDTYYSAFLGLRFTLPEGWEAADEDTLSQMSTDADRILDMQRGGDGENPDSVYHYELSATDPETGAGIWPWSRRPAPTPTPIWRVCNPGLRWKAPPTPPAMCSTWSWRAGAIWCFP